MNTYVMLSKLTEEGRKTIKNNPERINEVNKEVAALGVKVLHQYVSLGEFDFVNILEANSMEDVMKVSIELSSRGTVETHTMPVMTIETFIAMLKKQAVAK